MGTIHVCSSDNTAPEIDIRRIKHSRDVKDMISDQVEKMRTAHNAVEMYTNTPHFHDDPGDLSDAL